MRLKKHVKTLFFLPLGMRVYKEKKKKKNTTHTNAAFHIALASGAVSDERPSADSWKLAPQRSKDSVTDLV